MSCVYKLSLGERDVCGAWTRCEMRNFIDTAEPANPEQRATNLFFFSSTGCVFFVCVGWASSRCWLGVICTRTWKIARARNLQGDDALQIRQNTQSGHQSDSQSSQSASNHSSPPLLLLLLVLLLPPPVIPTQFGVSTDVTISSHSHHPLSPAALQPLSSR